MRVCVCVCLGACAGAIASPRMVGPSVTKAVDLDPPKYSPASGHVFFFFPHRVCVRAGVGTVEVVIGLEGDW